MWRFYMISRFKMLGLGCTALLLTLYWLSGAIKVEVSPLEKSELTAQPVLVSVYYETLCPDSKRFILDQLWPTYQAVSDIIDVDLIPYGKAYETELNNGTYLFHCQHGPDECYGNIIQTCAVKLLDIRKSLALIQCMESYSQSQAAGAKCARRQDIDYNKIEECVQSKQGNTWQHEMAKRTDSLKPPLHFVPWITFDGVYTREHQNRGLNDLLGLVCDLYKGPKPESCPK
ncbi:gamma-interferon-inducible lysosomal thiol reductase-like [Centruroides vittatus]|uniref:gamma-interferon-inducible lysosomal thiol reductase-like n=1 Tax=Centruroides vittatus TaxID=120091 RepID=UPI0035102233